MCRPPFYMCGLDLAQFRTGPDPFCSGLGQLKPKAKPFFLSERREQAATAAMEASKTSDFFMEAASVCKVANDSSTGISIHHRAPLRLYAQQLARKKKNLLACVSIRGGSDHRASLSGGLTSTSCRRRRLATHRR